MVMMDYRTDVDYFWDKVSMVSITWLINYCAIILPRIPSKHRFNRLSNNKNLELLKDFATFSIQSTYFK